MQNKKNDDYKKSQVLKFRESQKYIDKDSIMNSINELTLKIDSKYIEFLKLRKARDLNFIINYIKTKDSNNNIKDILNTDFLEYVLENTDFKKDLESKLKSIKVMIKSIYNMIEELKVVDFELITNLKNKERKLESLTDDNFLEKLILNKEDLKLIKIDKLKSYNNIELDIEELDFIKTKIFSNEE